jgi:hypothetical protein
VREKPLSAGATTARASAGERSIDKFRQRQRHLQFEASGFWGRATAMGEEGLLGARGVRPIALEQELAADAVEQGVGHPLAGLICER